MGDVKGKVDGQTVVTSGEPHHYPWVVLGPCCHLLMCCGHLVSLDAIHGWFWALVFVHVVVSLSCVLVMSSFHVGIVLALGCVTLSLSLCMLLLCHLLLLTMLCCVLVTLLSCVIIPICPVS